MAHDIFFKRSSRNWSRGADAPAKTPVVAVSGSAALKTAALGTMALGTFAGLAFITSPWWKTTPKPPIRPLMTRRIYLKTGTPAGRVNWSRR